MPRSYDGKTRLPLVIMFHGTGGTARGAMRQTGWAAKADEAGFFAIFPEATRPDQARPARFRGNPQIWNDGSGRAHAGRRNIDDVAFTNSLMDDLEARFAIDPRRIYVTGFSNGASMAFRLGIELSDRVAAIGPVAGHLWVTNQRPARSVSLAFIAGAKDPVNPLDEARARRPGGRSIEKPPLRLSLLSWTKMIGCSLRPKVARDENGVKTLDYGPCDGKAEVVFYIIEGMGHTWPGGKNRLPEWMVGKTTDKLNATDVLWEFFQGHPMG